MKIAAIILAAGKGERAGTFKPLALYEGETFIARTCKALKSAQVFSEIIVVGGFEHDRLVPAAEALSIALLVNSEFASGMHSSIQCGVRALKSTWDATLIAMVDQPHLQARDYRELVEAYCRCGGDLMRVVCNGRQSSPAIIGRRYRDEILAHSGGDRGCDYLFQKHPHRVRLFATSDERFLTDFDYLR